MYSSFQNLIQSLSRVLAAFFVLGLEIYCCLNFLIVFNTPHIRQNMNNRKN
jgi:DNA-directed RNA polymerase subunit N (RpoN/RPB10)